MLINLKNKNRLLLSFLAAGIIPFAIIVVISLNASRNVLSEQAFQKFKKGQTIKKAQIGNYFIKFRSDLKPLANTPSLSNAIDCFRLSFDDTGTINQEACESLAKPHSLLLGQFIDVYRYYDLLTISKGGSGIYGVRNEPDLGQNLLTGSLLDSLLAKHLSEGVEKLTILGFEPYPSSNGQHSAFVPASYYGHSALVLNKEGKNIFNMGY
jgi:methyl-accepting chemotaxis protein